MSSATTSLRRARKKFSPLAFLARSYGRSDDVVAVYSMKRSGQHAVMHWICDNADGRYLLLNDVHLNACPFDTTKGKHPYDSNSRLIRLSPFKLGRVLPKALLIYNYEDPLIPSVYRHGRGIGTYRRLVAVMVLRDIFNLFASRLTGLSRFDHTGRIAPVYKELWRVHAREYLGETDYLGGCVPVSFNDWSISPGYRDAAAERLGIRNRGPHTRVTREGGGSSFDSAGNFDPAKLNQRFLTLAENPTYRKAFAGEVELLDLNLEIFEDTLWEHRDVLRKLVNA